MSKFLFAALGLSAVAQAHITLTPNYGASAGGFFKFGIKVPHGTALKETTKLVIDIPHGITSAKPESVHGWDIDIETRAITPFISHGKTKDSAPSRITYTARCTGPEAPTVCTNDDHPGVDNNHLLIFDLQIKLGCDFGRDKDGKATNDATDWQGQHAVWFKMDQYVSSPNSNDGNEDEVNKLSWTGIAKDDESWGAAQPRPSPYLFIYSSASCIPSGDLVDDKSTGMRWGANAVVIAPVADQDPIKTKAEVLSLVDEAQLDMQEEITADIDNLEALFDARFSALESANQNATNIAVIALVLSAIVSSIFFFILILRLIKPRSLRYGLLGEEQSSDKFGEMEG